MYTIKGYTVTTVEQVQSILVVAKLQGNQVVINQCKAVIAKLSQ